MLIYLKREDLLKNGIEIGVAGFKGEGLAPAPDEQAIQVYMEVYNGILQVHIWNGGEDPAVTIPIAPI